MADVSLFRACDSTKRPSSLSPSSSPLVVMESQIAAGKRHPIKPPSHHRATARRKGDHRTAPSVVVATTSTRIKAACSNCRASHVACSHEQPCKRCVLNGLECVYLPRKKRRRFKKNSAAKGRSKSSPSAATERHPPPPLLSDDASHLAPPHPRPSERGPHHRLAHDPHLHADAHVHFGGEDRFLPSIIEEDAFQVPPTYLPTSLDRSGDQNLDDVVMMYHHHHHQGDLASSLSSSPSSLSSSALAIPYPVVDEESLGSSPRLDHALSTSFHAWTNETSFTGYDRGDAQHRDAAMFGHELSASSSHSPPSSHEPLMVVANRLHHEFLERESQRTHQDGGDGEHASLPSLTRAQLLEQNHTLKRLLGMARSEIAQLRNAVAMQPAHAYGQLGPLGLQTTTTTTTTIVGRAGTIEGAPPLLSSQPSSATATIGDDDVATINNVTLSGGSDVAVDAANRAPAIAIFSLHNPTRGLVLQCNAQFRGLLGFKNASEVANLSVRKILPARYFPHLCEATKRMEVQKTKSAEIDLIMVAKDGTEIDPVHVVYTVIFDSLGEPLHGMLFCYTY